MRVRRMALIEGVQKVDSNGRVVRFTRYAQCIATCAEPGQMESGRVIASRKHFSPHMSVIPLTLAISLCLVFTFVLFFLREHGRQRFSSAESDALLPLAEEIPRMVPSPKSRRAPGHQPRAVVHKNCGCKTGERPPCVGCLRRGETQSHANG